MFTVDVKQQCNRDRKIDPRFSGLSDETLYRGSSPYTFVVGGTLNPSFLTTMNLSGFKIVVVVCGGGCGRSGDDAGKLSAPASYFLDKRRRNGQLRLR